MNQFCRISIFRLGATVVLACANHAVSTATQPAVLANASNVDAIAKVVASGNNPFGKMPRASALIAQVTSILLSPAQTAQLTRLPIPIVAPAYLPAGFHLVRAEGEANQYANGDDDSGYAIDYQGENNTCLSVRSSQEGPRGLKKVSQVQTRFGLVPVYAETFHDRTSLVSFLRIKGNPILISGGSLPDRSANGGFQPCRAVSLETYTQVLRSLAVVK